MMPTANESEATLHTELAALRRRVAELEARLVAPHPRNETGFQPETSLQAQLWNAVNQAVIATDLAGRIIYWNRFAESLYGWPAAEVIGRDIMEVTPAPLMREQAATIMAALRQGRSWSGQFQVQRRNGSNFWASVTDSPIFDDSGELVGIAGISTDITAYKMAEAALRESEERLRAFFDNSPVGLAILDQELRYVAINPFLAAINCRPAAEHLGQVFGDLMPRLAAYFEPVFRRILATGEPVLNVEASSWPVQVEGRWITCVLGSYFPIFDPAGRPAGVGIALIDITERKQAEESLRTMADMLDTAPNSINVHDFEGRFLYANQMTFALHGYEAEEFMALNLHDLDVPESAALMEERMRLIAEQGQASFEVAHFRKDGTPMPLELFVKKVEWAGLPAMLSIGTDITERKQAEAALQQRNRELELLNRASQAFMSSLDLGEVLAIVLEEARRSLGVMACSAWLLDPPSGDLVCLEVTNPQGELVRGWRLPAEQGLAGWVAQHGQSLNVADTRHDKRHFKGVDRQTGLEIRSVLAVPLPGKEGVIGVLEMVDKQVGRFTAADQRLAELLAAVAASAIENARLYEALNVSETELRRRNRALALLNQVIAASAEGQPAEVILDVACRELGLALNMPHVNAWLLNEARTDVRMMAEYRTRDVPPRLNLIIPIPDPFVAALAPGFTRPLLIPDVHTSPHLALIRPFLFKETVSVLLLPLLVEGRVAGALVVSTTVPRSFTPEEIDLAGNVAIQVAGALTRSRLVQAQHRLSAAVEQTEDSIIITDPAGVVLYVNPAFECISGYDRAETIGREVGMIGSGKHEAEFYQAIWTTISAGQPWRGRVINRKKDGSLYTDEVTITPVRDEAGTVVAYVSVQRDMTRELELAAQLRQAQKMEAVGQLAGGVAHDFNNILTAIIGHANLVQMSLPKNSPVLEDLDGILSAAQRAAHLTRQLLTFARRQVSQPQSLNLNDVVMAMAPLLRRLIGEHIELAILLEPELGWTRVDPHQFEQLLMNLVVNARDAMSVGGKLTIGTANVTAGQVSEVGPGATIQLQVSDTGHGIAPEHKAHIFEPFFTTKEVGQGTGLGLATCFGIVQQHGGHITVESKPGQGATFKVYLPRVEAEAETTNPAALTSYLPRGEETILLVEDDLAVRHLTRRILAEQGYRVIEAANGAEALRLAERWVDAPLHLLLTDLVMPLVGGWELAGQLRGRWPGLKVLFMSGYADSVQIKPDRLEPGQAYLPKPFTAASLARQLRQLLDQSGGLQ